MFMLKPLNQLIMFEDYVSDTFNFILCPIHHDFYRALFLNDYIIERIFKPYLFLHFHSLMSLLFFVYVLLIINLYFI